MGIPISRAKLGMWLFLGTEIMFFTAFIGTYIVCFFGSPGWPTDTNATHIKIAAGGINTFVLILSSYFVVVAHEAMGLRNFARARQFLIYTMLLAFVFLGIKGYEYSGKFSHNILPGKIAEDEFQAMKNVVKEMKAAVEGKLDSLIAGSEKPHEKQAKLLQGYLGERGHRILVRPAMRYGHPSIASTLASVALILFGNGYWQQIAISALGVAALIGAHRLPSGFTSLRGIAAFAQRARREPARKPEGPGCALVP